MSENATESSMSAEPVDTGDARAESFEVSVKGTGVELTRDVDQATALNVIAIVLGGAAALPAATTTHGRQTAVQQPPAGTQRIPGGGGSGAEALDSQTTIGEYIDECGATQFSAKITAIGHFLELRLGQSSFTREEVKSQFKPAGEAQPANFSRDFSDAIQQRWIAEDPSERGQYFVTKTGKAAISAKFDKSSRRSSSSPARRKKPGASKADSGSSSPSENDDFQELDDDE